VCYYLKLSDVRKGKSSQYHNLNNLEWSYHGSLRIITTLSQYSLATLHKKYYTEASAVNLLLHCDTAELL
jgi:hypothetical protein